MQFRSAITPVRLGWMVLICIVAFGANTLLRASSKNMPPAASVIQQVNWLHDNGKQLDIANVKNTSPSSWRAIRNPVNLGFKKGAHWLKVELPVATEESAQALLEIAYPSLDKVDIWLYQASDLNSPFKKLHYGDTLPFSARALPHESFVLNLANFEQRPSSLIIRVETGGSIKLPLRLWSTSEFIAYSSEQRLAIGIMLGFLLAMAVSNLFFYLTTKNHTFLLYALHVVSFCFVVATLFGYGFAYIWPDNTGFQQKAMSVFANATMLFVVLFSEQLLELRALSAFQTKVMRALASLFLLNILSTLLLSHFYTALIFFPCLLTTVLYIFGLCIWYAIKKNKIAKYYSIAWSLLLACALLAMLDYLGWVTPPVGSDALLLYGIASEALFLGWVLAINYGAQNEEVSKAQAQALEAEKETATAKSKLLEVEQNAKDELEYKVQERTLELEITLRELSEANRELERINTLDALTGVRNRRHFDKRILAEGRRSRRERTRLCLVMLDIDFFKRVNDEKGHDVGDECLIHIAKLVKSFVKRPSDDFCRYGGEEFSLILPNTTEEGAKQLIESIRQSIENTPCESSQGSISMTISAGIASDIVMQEQGEKAILKAADEALYEAKANGRNCVVVAKH